MLVLVSASIGTIVAFQQNLIADFGGFLQNQSQGIIKDFLTLNGTALSGPLPFLILQLVFTLLAPKKGKTGMVGVIGLVTLGAIYTPAQIGEPILLRQFTPGNFNPTQTVILATNVLFSFLMFLFGIFEWRSRNRRAKSQQALQ